VTAVLLVALYSLRQVPASVGAPRVGQKAPDFFLLIKMENLLVSAICFPTQTVPC